MSYRVELEVKDEMPGEFALAIERINSERMISELPKLLWAHHRVENEEDVWFLGFNYEGIMGITYLNIGNDWYVRYEEDGRTELIPLDWLEVAEDLIRSVKYLNSYVGKES